jgi:lipid-A-disaccharide synthase
LKRLFDSVITEASRLRPDVAILVDYPDFNLRLARELKRLGIPVVYYVSPQLWAWRRGRIKEVKRNVAKMLVLFPFEESIYREASVPVAFVGHPLVDHVAPPEDRAAVARALGLDGDRPMVALLPGSRNKEVAFNLPPMLGAVKLLRERRPELQFVLGAAPHLHATAFREAKSLGVAALEGASLQVMSAARVAIVASGTATVETALTLTPMVVVYRLSALTYFLGKPLVSVTTYAMVNLIAGRTVVPELIQRDFTAARVTEETLRILDPGAPRTRMLQDLAEVRAKLGRGGATARAADEVLKLLKSSRAEDSRLP